MSLGRRAFAWLVRTVLGVYYRRIETIGLDNLPAEGPCLVLPNHNNSVVDPLVVASALPRPVRFVAKATLWNDPVMAAVLDLSDGVPIARAEDAEEMRDAGMDDRATVNDQAFAALHEAFENGDCVGMFPEGLSHVDNDLARIKGGAGVLALEYAERHGYERSLPLVPVGLSWSAPEMFRSDVVVVVGEPIDPSEWYDLHRERGRRAFVPITRRLRSALEAVTLTGASWRRRRRVERACDLLETLHRRDPRSWPLPEGMHGFALRRAALDRAEQLEHADPERLARLRRAVTRLEALERAAGLAPRAGWGPLGSGRSRLTPARALVDAAATAVTWPAVAVGLLVGWPLWAVPRWWARRKQAGGGVDRADLLAVQRVYAAIGFTPLWLAAVTCAMTAAAWVAPVSWWWGPIGAGVTAVLAVWGLQRVERTGRTLQAVAAAWRLGRRAGMRNALRRRREEVARLLHAEAVEFTARGA